MIGFDSCLRIAAKRSFTRPAMRVRATLRGARRDAATVLFFAFFTATTLFRAGRLATTRFRARFGAAFPPVFFATFTRARDARFRGAAVFRFLRGNAMAIIKISNLPQ